MDKTLIIQPESGLELTFDDSSSVSDWARDYIATAVKYNIISGYGDNTVHSGDVISREQMVAILLRAFNFGVSDTDEELTFADSDRITWSKPYISRAVSLGLLKVSDDNKIRPDAGITRAECFALIHRCLNLNTLLTASN